MSANCYGRVVWANACECGAMAVSALKRNSSAAARSFKYFQGPRGRTVVTSLPIYFFLNASALLPRPALPPPNEQTPFIW
eukprot:2613153-Pleurochrysis_carterae.AAC.2